MMVANVFFHCVQTYTVFVFIINVKIINRPYMNRGNKTSSNYTPMVTLPNYKNNITRS